MRAKNGHNNVKVRNKVWRSLGGRTQSSPKESGKKLDHKNCFDSQCSDWYVIITRHSSGNITIVRMHGSYLHTSELLQHVTSITDCKFWISLSCDYTTFISKIHELWCCCEAGKL